MTRVIRVWATIVVASVLTIVGIAQPAGAASTSSPSAPVQNFDDIVEELAKRLCIAGGGIPLLGLEDALARGICP